jgi:hypothetical protein
MGKIYNYVLNSQIASTTAGNTVGEKFFIDWTQMDNTPYKVTFSFMSANQVSTNAQVANIYCDLGQGATTTMVGSGFPTGINSDFGFRSGFLGNLEVRSYTNSTPTSGSYLYASTTTNPPIYILNRPQNNYVFIEIHQSLETQFTNYSPIPAMYSMILSFESC